FQGDAIYCRGERQAGADVRWHAALIGRFGKSASMTCLEMPSLTAYGPMRPCHARRRFVVEFRSAATLRRFYGLLILLLAGSLKGGTCVRRSQISVDFRIHSAGLFGL